MMIISIIIF